MSVLAVGYQAQMPLWLSEEPLRMERETATEGKIAITHLEQQ